MEGRVMLKEFANTPMPQIFAIQVQSSVRKVDSEQFEAFAPALTQLLQEFNDLFVEPKSMPPHRSHDHHIVLKEGIPPVNVRPYSIRPYRRILSRRLCMNCQRQGLLD